ncbi:hypothetical protein ACWGNZ_14735 [Sphingomonas zeae]
MIDKAKLVEDQEHLWRKEQLALSLHRDLVQISLDASRAGADQDDLAERHQHIRSAAIEAGLLIE